MQAGETTLFARGVSAVRGRLADSWRFHTLLGIRS